MAGSSPTDRARQAILAVALVASCCLADPVLATPLEPIWKLTFEEPISWQRVTSLGDLIVGTPAALYALERETGEVRWSRTDLGALSAAGFEEIPGAPLVVIDDGQPDGRTLILNVMTGALVFDSSAENIVRVASRHFLPHSGSLLIAGIEAGNPQPTLFLYGISDGKRLWSSDALSAGMNNLMRFMLTAALVATDATPVQSAPLELDDGTFVLGAMGNLYRFDSGSGEVLWKSPYAGGSFELERAPERPDVVYVGAEERDDDFTSTQYQAFRISDGKPIWKKPVRFNKPMNRLSIPVDRGLIVSEGDQDKGRLRLLDYDSGESLWGNKGKGIEIKGQVVDYAFTDAGIVLTTGFDSNWTDKGTEYLLYVVDGAAGALRFEEPLEVKGRMLTTELIPRGLLYVTSHEINVFDPTSGRLLNEPVLRGKSPLVAANEGDTLFAFNSDDGHLYALDRATGRIAQLSAAPFEFEGKDRATGLEVVDEKLVLLGQQTVAGFDREGSLVFNTYHPAPREPGWLRALAWAEGVRAGMASAYAGLYSTAAMAAAAEAEEGSVGREIAAEFQRGFGELQQGYAGLAHDYVSFARHRYEASAQSRDFAFMMVADAGGVELAQISKRDGRIIAAVPMNRDREPDYEVDDIASQIFYRPSASVIEAYQF